MHELFARVLSKRDLSRAGDLFQIPDSEIVGDLTEVVRKVKYFQYAIELTIKTNHL